MKGVHRVDCQLDAVHGTRLVRLHTAASANSRAALPPSGVTSVHRSARSVSDPQFAWQTSVAARTANAPVRPSAQLETAAIRYWPQVTGC